MSRRRRQKNTLLPKVFAIAVAVNVVAVLIAAQFGALNAIKREFGASKVVLLAPAEAPKEKAKPEKKEKKAAAVRKSSGANAKSARSNHPRANAPAVVAAGASTGDGTGGPVVDQGTGKAGDVPTGPKPGTGVKPNPPVDTQPQPQPQPEPITKPTLPVTKPPTNPTAPVAEPKFIDAEPTSQPQPTIPDDLLTQEIDKDYIAELQVGTDGVPISAKTTQSTGIDELDRLGLDTAKKWRFTPATLGGVPTEQTVRIKIQFRVQ